MCTITLNCISQTYPNLSAVFSCCLDLRANFKIRSGPIVSNNSTLLSFNDVADGHRRSVAWTVKEGCEREMFELKMALLTHAYNNTHTYIHARTRANNVADGIGGASRGRSKKAIYSPLVLVFLHSTHKNAHAHTHNAHTRAHTQSLTASSDAPFLSRQTKGGGVIGRSRRRHVHWCANVAENGKWLTLSLVKCLYQEKY